MKIIENNYTELQNIIVHFYFCIIFFMEYVIHIYAAMVHCRYIMEETFTYIKYRKFA